MVISWSCSEDDNPVIIPPKIITIETGPNAEEEIQNAFIDVQDDGWTISLAAGTYEITGTLTMDGKNDVTIKGQGAGSTILSFDTQTDGGDGILISNSSNVTIRDLQITDAVGDALKVTTTNGIIIDGVTTLWSGTPSSENGGYGIYPVLCSDVIIWNSMARGA